MEPTQFWMWPRGGSTQILVQMASFPPKNMRIYIFNIFKIYVPVHIFQQKKVNQYRVWEKYHKKMVVYIGINVKNKTMTIENCFGPHFYFLYTFCLATLFDPMMLWGNSANQIFINSFYRCTFLEQIGTNFLFFCFCFSICVSGQRILKPFRSCPRTLLETESSALFSLQGTSSCWSVSAGRCWSFMQLNTNISVTGTPINKRKCKSCHLLWLSV